MELPKRSQRSSSTALLLIASIAVGMGVLSFFNLQSARDQSRKSLEERSVTIASALDTSAVLKLKGNPSDANLPEYHQIKTRLTAIKQANSDVRSIYITGSKDGKIFFYVDSEQPNSKYYSPPGEEYTEATPAFKNIFYSSPQPLVEGPISDHFGTWVSGLAPMFNPHTGRVMAVVGLDMDASSYNNMLIGALDIPVGAGLAFIILVSIYELARRREEQAILMRSELVSIASHELRSPMVGMRWAIEGLLKSTTNKAEQTKLEAIHGSVLHMQEAAEDVLQFTSVTAQRKLNMAMNDIHALIKDVCDTQTLVAQQKNVTLVVDDSWPEKVMILCDADRIKRALYNVVSNAIKYTRNDTSVMVSYQKVGSQHQISVSDHGIGIPASEIQRVFTGFYRASNAKASGVQGTGLGLYLTRTIFEQHKGKVTVTSKEGEGTTFVLVLPGRTA